MNGTLETVIELKKAKTIHSIQLNTYQDIRPWIWFPSKVQFFISKDGVSWDEVYNTTFTELQKKEGAMKHNFIFEAVEPYKADLSQVKYVQIIATPAFEKIPDWHLGAGGKPWIFADEIIIF